MDISEFFEQSTGKWMSQRTSHHPTFKQPEAGKSELYIDTLPQDDPTVVQICQEHGVDPARVVCGVQTRWEATLEPSKGKKSGSAVMVAIADPTQANQGQLLRPKSESHATGRYILGSDDALVLIAESGELYSEERLWFESPNFRLRTSIMKRADGFSTASFCSEIRMMAKPAQ